MLNTGASASALPVAASDICSGILRYMCVDQPTDVELFADPEPGIHFFHRSELELGLCDFSMCHCCCEMSRVSKDKRCP